MPTITAISAASLKALATIAPKTASLAGGRPQLCGAYFDPAGYAVATDGHILLAVRLEAGFDGPGFIVPRESALAAVKPLSARRLRDWVYGVRADGRDITIDGPGTQFRGLAIDGRFPDWRRVIPQEFSGELVQFNPDLLAALQAAIATITGRPGFVVAVAHNGKDAAAVANAPAGVLALIMPTRLDAGPCSLAAGAVADFLAPPPAPDADTGAASEAA